MISRQTKIEPSNKSLVVKHAKHAQPTMDKFSNLSQVAQIAAISFKHAKVGMSFIPSVPVNYTCSKRQKAGNSYIPRFTIINSKQTKNGKPSPSHVKGVNLKKVKTSVSHELVKNRRSYIPRRVAKKVEPLPYRIREKVQRKTVEPKPISLFGKSRIPVPISTKKANISNRASRSRICISTKKEDVCVSRFDAIQDDQVRVLALNAVKSFDAQMHVLAFDDIKKDGASSRASTPTKSLIPVRNLTGTLFKKRVSPLQPSTVKKDELARISTFTSNDKANNLTCTSLKNKHTRLQKSVNRPEASISITYNKVEISTTIYIIKPDISSVSLLCKAEKDLSSQHQIEENREDVPSFFDNFVKTIVRFSKDLFSKMT